MNMMIFSTKITKAKLLTLALICSCIALIIIVSLPHDDVPTLNTEYSGATNEERVSFLQNFGWEISGEPSEVVDVVIPESFDATYQSYNNLQKTQGFDLEEYKGMKATRYTYNVKNFPKADKDDNIEANILVVGSVIVAGDVTSAELGGFMQGLAKPAINVNDTEPGTKPVVADGEGSK